MIEIRAIGKLKTGSSEQNIINDYLKKTREKVVIKEFIEKKNLSDSELKNAEADLLLSHLNGNDFVVALDEHGKTLSSRELATQLKTIKDQARSIVFLIGGANGHGEAVKKRANLMLSFGRMTLPHFLMRVVLMEQIYRMTTIWAGHPYHRD